MIARPSKSIWIWDVQAGSVYICRVAQDRCAEVERRLVQCAHIHLHNQVSWRPKRGCHTGALTEQISFPEGPGSSPPPPPPPVLLSMHQNLPSAMHHTYAPASIFTRINVCLTSASAPGWFLTSLLPTSSVQMWKQLPSALQQALEVFKLDDCENIKAVVNRL